MPFRKGTAIVTIATDESVVMVADKLGYGTPHGAPVPAVDPFQKVYSFANRVLVGSAGILRDMRRWDVGFEGNKPRCISLKYEFKDWISDFFAKGSHAHATPEEIALGIFTKARETFQRVEVIAKEGRWDGDNPDDPLVIYTIAGFSDDFAKFGLYQTEIKLNSKGDGFVYVPPAHKLTKIHLTGQTEFIAEALAEKEPYASSLRSHCKSCALQIENLFPDTKAEVKETAIFAVGLVRVQAEFKPQTVGNPVTIMIADRESRRAVMGTL